MSTFLEYIKSCIIEPKNINDIIEKNYSEKLNIFFDILKEDTENFLSSLINTFVLRYFLNENPRELLKKLNYENEKQIKDLQKKFFYWLFGAEWRIHCINLLKNGKKNKIDFYFGTDDTLDVPGQIDIELNDQKIYFHEFLIWEDMDEGSIQSFKKDKKYKSFERKNNGVLEFYKDLKDLFEAFPILISHFSEPYREKIGDGNVKPVKPVENNILSKDVYEKTIRKYIINRELQPFYQNLY